MGENADLREKLASLKVERSSDNPSQGMLLAVNGTHWERGPTISFGLYNCAINKNKLLN
jgi:hypothetical protein